MSGDDRDTVVQPQSAEEMRVEFRTAQRRRLASRGATCWRDTELPEQGVQSVESPPRKIE